MQWIKILSAPFIWIYNNSAPIDTAQIAGYEKNNGATINPATGLPMMGAFDSQGNLRGTSTSTSHPDWHNDYNRRHSSSSSSYDPFNNRY
jgi:hypothetical protein